jgi:tetratricopeptide (TPR) repeat protein
MNLSLTQSKSPVGPNPNLQPLLHRSRSRLLRVLAQIGLTLLTTFNLLPAVTPVPSTAFEEANRLYEQGLYRDAAKAYQTILDEAIGTSAALHFNLGNALFRSGEVGRAIVHYRLAQQCAPRDPDVRANLRFARRSVYGGGPAPTPWWQPWINRLTLTEWAVLWTTLLWTWLGTLIWTQWRPASRRSWRLPKLALLTSLALTGSAVLLSYQGRHHQTAVVLKREAAVRYGPLPESQAHYTVRDGMELSVHDSKDGWIQVTDASDRTGWIQQSDVALFPPKAASN